MAAPLPLLSPEIIMETTTQPTMVNVNDQLVEFSNLLNALRYLYEEIESTKPDASVIDAAVQNYIKSDAFSKRMVNYLKRYQIPSMTEAVSTEIKHSLDSQLENYILAKLDERIDAKIRSVLANR